MKGLPTFLFLCAVLICITAGAAVGAGMYFNRPLSFNEGYSFTIEKGSSVSAIAHALEEKHIIRSSLFFMALTRIFNTESNLQAGNFYIAPGSSSLQIHDLFLTGKQVLKTVTIPEGYTLNKTAELLDEKGIVDQDAFLQSATDRQLLAQLNIPANTAEGYIFPNTYRFAEDFPADKTLIFLVNSFWKHLEKIYPQYTEMTQEMIHQHLIIASIVEREYRIPEEAPFIASVFLNRIKIGMPLQSCATVVYAITEEYHKPHPSYLTYDDLDIDSQYNTYRHSGLPPAPISNPGETALKSVFFPASTEYLYFVLQDANNGYHYFSKSLIEHNKAKQFYIKGR